MRLHHCTEIKLTAVSQCFASVVKGSIKRKKKWSYKRIKRRKALTQQTGRRVNWWSCTRVCVYCCTTLTVSADGTSLIRTLNIQRADCGRARERIHKEGICCVQLYFQKEKKIKMKAGIYTAVNWDITGLWSCVSEKLMFFFFTRICTLVIIYGRK